MVGVGQGRLGWVLLLLLMLLTVDNASRSRDKDELVSSTTVGTARQRLSRLMPNTPAIHSSSVTTEVDAAMSDVPSISLVLSRVS